MNSPMSGYAGNAETGTLLQQHSFGELNDLLQRNHGVLGGSSERAVGLSAKTPRTATDPFPRHSFAHCINSARTIAVRNDTRIWHPDAKSILTFLHIPRIYARKGDANPDFACERLRLVHLADDQDIWRSTLLFVPSGLHDF